MNAVSSSEVEIITGNTARYIKQKWVNALGSVDPTAFDLRANPPELYVSFYMSAEIESMKFFVTSFNGISSKFRNPIDSGAMARFDIKQCLEEVNDEEPAVIGFVEKNLPHCGMIYLVSDLTRILEAKATLAFLAKSNLMNVSEIMGHV